jgi:hypothetical protein
MERHSPEVMRSIAGYVIWGIVILLLSMSLEVLADWKPKDIVQSLGAATVMLVLAMIRGGARREAKDKLWITALSHWLTGKLVALITWLHAAEEKEKKEEERASAAATSAPAGQVGPADVAPRSSEGDLPGGSTTPSDTQEKAEEAGNAAHGDFRPPLGITERDGPWVRREARVLWEPEVPPRPPRIRKTGHEG